MIQRGLLFFAIYVGRIIAKILDFYAFPEIMDRLWQIVKLNTRNLTAIEEQEARSIFGNKIDYQRVRIDEASFIAWMRAKLKDVRVWGLNLPHN